MGAVYFQIHLHTQPERLIPMPTYSAPGSDEDRLAVLKTLLSATAADANLNKLLPATLRTSINTFVTGYEPVVQAGAAAEAGRAKEVKEKDAAQEKLGTYTRDFFEVLKRRTEREEHNVAVLVHYGLTQAGDVPKMRAADDLVKAANSIVTGEIAAVAAGFPAMTNPSAVQVDAMLQSFTKESGEVKPADEKVRAAQAAAGALRDGADDLISDAKDEVSHALRKEDAPTIRRVLRQLGYTFTPKPGEQPEPPPPTPAPV